MGYGGKKNNPLIKVDISEEVTAQLADNAQELKNVYKSGRILLEKGGQQHSTGYQYTAFGSGVFFKGKEIYAIRSGNGHYTTSDPATWGKLFWYIRKGGANFEVTTIPLDYSTAGVEYRDINLSVSNDGEYLYLSVFSYNTTIYKNYLWVFDRDLNLVSPKIQIPSGTDEVLWGNTLQTPSGKLLKYTYKVTTPYKLTFYRTTTPILSATDFSTMQFEKVNELTSSWYINESAFGYWKNKIIIISRGGNTPVCTIDDLEGGGTITLRKNLNVPIHAPCILTKNRSNKLLGTASSLDGELRHPVMFTLGDGYDFTSSLLDINKTMGGYTTLVPNTFGYGVMYYEDEGTGTNLWFRDVNLQSYNLPNIYAPPEYYASNIIINGDFKKGTADWTVTNATMGGVSGNELSFTATAANGLALNTKVPPTVGHIYYVSAKVKALSNQVRLNYGASNAFHSGGGAYETLSLISTATNTSHGYAIADNNTSGWQNVSFKEPLLLDLTDIFGAGNEPDLTMMNDILTKPYNPWFSIGKTIIDFYDYVIMRLIKLKG